MATSVRMLIEEDCELLLERALLNKTINAFGEDGFGQYGKCDTPQYYNVTHIFISIKADDDNAPTIVTGKLLVRLLGYDSDITGLVITDKNFDISFQNALAASGIPHDALVILPADEQPRFSVAFDINIGKLLNW